MLVLEMINIKLIWQKCSIIYKYIICVLKKYFLYNIFSSLLIILKIAHSSLTSMGGFKVSKCLLFNNVHTYHYVISTVTFFEFICCTVYAHCCPGIHELPQKIMAWIDFFHWGPYLIIYITIYLKYAQK